MLNIVKGIKERFVLIWNCLRHWWVEQGWAHWNSGGFFVDPSHQFQGWAAPELDGWVDSFSTGNKKLLPLTLQSLVPVVSSPVKTTKTIQIIISYCFKVNNEIKFAHFIVCKMILLSKEQTQLQVKYDRFLHSSYPDTSSFRSSDALDYRL